MKLKLLICIATICIVFVPNILLGQQVNQGYHLALTPYAELYQKDSLKNKIPNIKKQPVADNQKMQKIDKNKSTPLIRKCRFTAKKADKN
jgi:hypothetical protein